MAHRLEADLGPFLEFLSDFRAPSTVAVYEKLLRRVLQELPPEADWGTLTAHDLEQAARRVYGRHSASTLNVAVTALRQFCLWAHRAGRIPTPDLAYALEPVPKSKGVPQHLTPEQEAAFVQWVLAKPTRTRAAMLLLLRGGLRPGEVATFRPERWEGGILWGQVGASPAVARAVAVIPETEAEAELLRRYIPADGTEPPFRYAPQSLGVMLQEAAEQLGFSVSPRALRYTYAMRLIGRGISVEAVLRLMGLSYSVLEQLKPPTERIRAQLQEVFAKPETKDEA